ncbi:ROK family protein [soil metagenome]
MPYGIGVDLGGTNIKIVAVSEEGQMFERSTCETQTDSPGSWVETIRQRIKEIENDQAESARWIGLAAPGLAALDSLSIASMPGKLRGLEGLNWTDSLQTSHRVPVLNDAHAALLGEAWIGAAVGYRNAVLLTLGTGVGGAILAEGRLFKGHIGRAGHLGHISLNPDGPPDIVGTPGSLEQTIGNSTLAERSAGRFTSTRQLVQAHLNGDEQASEVWLRSVYNLAAGITSIINALDPEVIIIGGGIAQAGPALFDPLERFLEKVEWQPQGQRVRIIPAVLGDFAGALGAAYFAMNCGAEE